MITITDKKKSGRNGPVSNAKGIKYNKIDEIFIGLKYLEYNDINFQIFNYLFFFILNKSINYKS